MATVVQFSKHQVVLGMKRLSGDPSTFGVSVPKEAHGLEVGYFKPRIIRCAPCSFLRVDRSSSWVNFEVIASGKSFEIDVEGDVGAAAVIGILAIRLEPKKAP